MIIFGRKMYVLSMKVKYQPPICEVLPALCEGMLASSFNDDNNTEYFDDENGGWL